MQDYGEQNEQDYGFAPELGETIFTEWQAALFVGSQRVSERIAVMCAIDDDGLYIKERVMFPVNTSGYMKGRVRVRLYRPEISHHALFTMDVNFGGSGLHDGEQVFVEPARKFSCSS